MTSRARAVFAAGVDIALHCNGDLSEARPVLDATPELAGAALCRADAALKIVAARAEPFDAAQGRARLQVIWPALAA